MTNMWHISVLIPARDEEDLLPRCLRSVLEARAALEGRATCDVIIAVDRSIDSSFEIAQKRLGGGEVRFAQRTDRGMRVAVRNSRARSRQRRGAILEAG